MNDVPDGVTEDTLVRDATRPPMTFIVGGLGDGTVDLYIGDQFAASDDTLLKQHNIAMVLNCALNLDINYCDRSIDREPDAKRRSFGPNTAIRAAKVGLIDGPGNHPSMLLAACQVMVGLLNQTLPIKASYPLWQPGNLLVHCRGGRSRSLTVSAIYLHRTFPDRWPTFDAALQYVREQRMIDRDEYDYAPNAGMLELARQALALLESGKGILP
jgi:myo-inositol-1(or 4)-monophosphatase